MILQGLDTPSFSVSVGYIITTAVVMRLARLILLQVVASKYYQIILLEFIATFELLATCFEFGVVIETHGFLAYTGLMLIMFNYWGHAWKSPNFPNQSATVAPHPHILDILQRKPGLKTSLTKLFAQLTAASLVYTVYVKPIWSLGYRITHLKRIQQAHCFTHLQVSVTLGLVVEALATFAFSFAIQAFGQRKHNFLSLPLTLVSIVYAGITYTGCYFNPILASTIQFGCGGITWRDHLVVYWGGPLLGSIIFEMFSKFMTNNSLLRNGNAKKFK
ncbi:aquaporin-11 [Folsomia candida]|uniref:Aquaporin n=1 Tax=Folsomia candida TaxID=158441 RepID=A0A226ETT4_FOLCA|nr:aquaporin-11 [Folsomia candida]OXA60231.1 Aquaporin-11 [Folsomia candida]